MIRTLHLARALRLRIEEAAQQASPRECCGLVAGDRDGQTAWALAVHPVHNLAAASDRFELDPAEHIRLLRAARAGGHSLIGCYHSHLNGQARPSDADKAGAGEEDFLWLIAAVADGRVTLEAFVYAEGGFAPVVLAEATSA